MPDDLKDLRESVDSLTASALISQVQAELLLALIEDVAKRTGFTQIDGLPLRDWFQQKKIEQLQVALIAIEDSSPAAAAYLQKQIDESERRLRDKGQAP